MSLFGQKFMQNLAAGAVSAAMVVQPQLLMATEVTTTTPTVAPVQSTAAPSDVVLQDDNALIGHIVDAQGLPLAKSPVSVQTGGKEVARVLTDDKGAFRVAELKGGVYQIASEGHQGVYRLWAPRTAPPVAAKGLSIVSQPTDVVRGQYGPPPGPGGPLSQFGQWVAEHPILTGVAVATAIAVPIAVSDDDDPATP